MEKENEKEIWYKSVVNDAVDTDIPSDGTCRRNSSKYLCEVLYCKQVWRS